MVYRVRYNKPGDRQQLSETVEAHSPAEAMLKFQMMRDSAGPGDVITSVTEEAVANVFGDQAPASIFG